MPEELFKFLEHYSATIVCCICFALFLIINKAVSKKVVRYFSYAMVSIVLLITTETIQSLIPAGSKVFTLHVIASGLSYIFRVAILFFIIMVPTRHWKTKHKIWNSVPFIVFTIIMIVSIPTGIVYSFDSAHSFHRGPLGYLPFIMSALYLLELVIISIWKFRKGDSKEGVICLSTMVFCIVAVILETLYEFTGLVPGVAVISLIFYYVGFVVSRYSRDQLTDAFLRYKFFDDSERIIRPVYIVCMNLNDLRTTNESKGHLSGDKLLEEFSSTVRSMLFSNSRLYRLGDDEFAVLYRVSDDYTVETFIELLRNRLKLSNISFIAGYCVCKNKKEFEKSFIAAKQMMCQDKLWQDEEQK